MSFFKSNVQKTQVNDQATIEISIVQMARKRTLMRTLEQGEWTLTPPPSNKVHMRDAPRMECASLKKMYDRSALAESVRGAIKLRVVPATEISDRSAPIIEEGITVRFSERRAFLSALLLQVEQFYQRVLSAVSHIHHTSLETAIYVRENAPAKVQGMMEAGSSKVHDIYEAGRETAASTQTKATHLIDSSKEVVTNIVRSGAQTASNVKNDMKTNAQGIIETSQEIGQEVAEVVIEAQANAAELFDQSTSAIATTAKGVVSSVSSKTSALASAVANKVNKIYAKSKTLLSNDQDEILLTKRRRPIRRATSEASIYKAYSELLLDVEKNRQNLNHVLLSEIRDRSKPFIQSPEARQQNMTKQTLAVRGNVMNEIKRSATCMTLNHVSIRDASRPALPPTLRNLQSDSRKKLVAEINETDISKVLHVSPVPTSDRSAPVLPFGNSVQLDKYESTKKSMLQQVQAGVDLSHFSPRLMKDRSAPIVVTSPGLGSM